MRVAALLIAVAVPNAALAQQYEPASLLYETYGLWGMMDGAANFCWKTADFDGAYMDAYLQWIGRNLPVRDELDGVLARLNEAPDFASDAETAASKGIADILEQTTNPDEVCTNWRAGTEAGAYDAEIYLGEQLGLLRERDGM